MWLHSDVIVIIWRHHLRGGNAVVFPPLRHKTKTICTIKSQQGAAAALKQCPWGAAYSEGLKATSEVNCPPPHLSDLLFFYLGWGRSRPLLALVDCLCWARKDMAWLECPTRSLDTLWCRAIPWGGGTERFYLEKWFSQWQIPFNTCKYPSK